MEGKLLVEVFKPHLHLGWFSLLPRSSGVFPRTLEVKGTINNISPPLWAWWGAPGGRGPSGLFTAGGMGQSGCSGGIPARRRRRAGKASLGSHRNYTGPKKPESFSICCSPLEGHWDGHILLGSSSLSQRETFLKLITKSLPLNIQEHLLLSTSGLI